MFSIYSTHEYFDQLAYTEDNILIHNLRTYNLWYDHVSYRYVIECFKEFNVRKISYEELWNGAPSYVVKFSSPEEAARALRDNELNELTIPVKACDSLKQPDGIALTEQLNVNEFPYNCCYNKNNKTCLLKFDRESREHILQNLNLSDQLYFALVCPHFYKMLPSLLLRKHKSLNTKTLQDLTRFKLRVFLQMVGPQVRELIVNFDYAVQCMDTVLKDLGFYCRNVLKLHICENGKGSIKKLIKRMPLLRELKLLDCHLDNDFIKFLKRFDNLKHLYIIDASNLNSSEIRKLRGIKFLKFFGIPTPLNDMFQGLRNLEILDIRHPIGGIYCRTRDYENIANNLLKLKILKIDCTKGNFISLAELPSLEILDITLNKSPNISIARTFFKKVEQNQENPLKKLEITLHSTSLKIAYFISKLESLQSLKWNVLNINNRDSSINVFALLPNLKKFTFNIAEDNTSILLLVHRCLKLKTIYFSGDGININSLIKASVAVLKKVRAEDLRTDCVEFCFNNISDPNKSDFEQYSDFLKITQSKLDFLGKCRFEEL